METRWDALTEEFLEREYFVLDLLPEQVPLGSRGQYFRIEEYWLLSGEKEKLLERFYRILLKLNCYYDFDVLWQDRPVRNPKPAELMRYLMNLLAPGQEPLRIFLDDDKAMVHLIADDLYLTVYGPDERLQRILTELARSEGLFFWQPKMAEEG